MQAALVAILSLAVAAAAAVPGGRMAVASGPVEEQADRAAVQQPSSGGAESARWEVVVEAVPGGQRLLEIPLEACGQDSGEPESGAPANGGWASDDRVSCDPADGGSPRFGIAYRHSVEHTPVIEWFELRKGLGLVLVSTEYRSYGAGLPTEPPPGATFRWLEDRFVIEGIALPIADLVVHPLPFTQHTLLAGGRRWELSPLVPEGAAVRVRVEQVGAGDG